LLGARQVSIPNRLLAALPRKDYRKLLPLLEPVKLAFGETLYESHARIRQVYFPNDCFVSMLTTVGADRAAEVGLIGPEGMIGVPMALGVAVSPFRAVVQGEGTAMRMRTADFRRNFSTSAALKREVFLFTHLLMIQIAQTAGWNRFHLMTPRMAPWLVMTTRALIRGVRRVGVSVAMSALRDRKVIAYRRGIITILDQGGLVAAACGCYKTVKDTS